MSMLKGVLLTALLLLSMQWVEARERSKSIPEGGYFRHTTPDGVVHLNRTLVEDAIHHGYQLLDRRGRVVETVEAVPFESEADRQARREQLREQRAQEQRDRELRRLYGGPEDAIRARDRNVAALRLSISYAENNLAQLQASLDNEIAQAARVERAGREVSDDAREAIARLERQIASSEEEIAKYRQEMKETVTQFGPIIERLRVLAED